MKKYDHLKIIQLILFFSLTIFCLILVFINPDIYHKIAVDNTTQIVFFIIWITLGMSLFFIYLDLAFLSRNKKSLRELDYAIHSDPLAGIANRYGCDSVIESYMERHLPESLGIIMMEITNISEINNVVGHLAGNRVISLFSTFLITSSRDLCFVGRNGGNKFLAIFEEGSEEKFQTFMERINGELSIYNENPDIYPIKCSYGISYQAKDHCSSIVHLIALSNHRLLKQYKN